ncbi:ribonuclease P protein subunit p25-like protein isoform X1 [Scophthalmus maximus]|nr:ribonuclease P protein subunit p25-like protein isoform X1 [Scophthalmus maximus]
MSVFSSLPLARTKMENYSKARTLERPSLCPFPGLAPDTPKVRVKDGSKIRHLLRYALSRMEAKPGVADEAGRQEAASRPLCRQIVFTASAKGVSKAITCAEIVKRRVKGLHQLTRLLYGTAVEVWEPLEPGAGLDSLTVSRNVPAIWILLSLEPLDCSQPGYQAPGRYDALWAQSANREEEAAGGSGVTGQRPGFRRKRGRGGGKGPGRHTGRSRDAEK